MIAHALLIVGFAAVPFERPNPTLLRDVRPMEASAEPVCLLLEDGRISAVLPADAELPPGVTELDGKGRLVLPAFVDAFTYAGCKTPEPKIDPDAPDDPRADVWIDMRRASRKGIAPAFRAVEVFELEKKTVESYRKSGFGTLHSAPHGELLSGTSTLALTREAATRDTVLRPEVFSQAAFSARGKGYPSTLMGYMAQLRQLFLDAQHQRELAQRRTDGLPGPRPPYDADLDAALAILEGEERLMCHADRASDIERWIRLADEFGFQIVIQGGREAWKLTDVLLERDIPVFLTLDWGDEVVDPDAEDEKGKKGKKDEAVEAAFRYEEPLAVRRERRRLWEEKRDCALRLAESGLSFCFGSGEGGPKDLVQRVRELVEAGLPLEAARAGLTETPARLLGTQGQQGRIEAGFDATFALWNVDPLLEKAKIAHLFVEGFDHDFHLEDEAGPDEGVDVTGIWEIEFEGEEETAKLELTMGEDGRTKATLTLEAERMVDMDGRVTANKLELSGRMRQGQVEVPLELDAELVDEALTGTLVTKMASGHTEQTFGAEREPQGDER